VIKQDIFNQKNKIVQKTREEINELCSKRNTLIENSNEILKINRQLYNLRTIELDLDGSNLNQHKEKIIQLEENRENTINSLTTEINKKISSIELRLEEEIKDAYNVIAESMDEGFEDSLGELGLLLKFSLKKEYIGELIIESASRWKIRFKSSNFLKNIYQEPLVFIIQSSKISHLENKYVFQWSLFTKESDMKYIGMTRGSDEMAGSEIVKDLMCEWEFRKHVHD